MKIFSALVLAALLTACASRLPVSPDARFDALEREYVIDFLARNPVVATYLGGAALDASLADVDGKLRNYTAAGLTAEDQALAAFRDRFTGVDPATLSAEHRIDREVALAQIAFVLRQHARRYAQRSLDSYVDEPFRGVDWQLQGMTQTGPSSWGTEHEWRLVIERAHRTGAYLRAAQDELAAGIAAGNTPDWRMIRSFGLQSSAADAEYFETTLPELARTRMGAQAALLDDLRRAAHEAALGYRAFNAYVRAQFVADETRDDDRYVKPPFRGDRYAAGTTEYDWALKNNLQLDTTAAQLYEQSWPVVQHTRAQMIALARTIGAARRMKLPAVDDAAVLAVIHLLEKDAPKSDAEVIAWYRDAGARMVDYARRTGLFEVPDNYTLEVVETPPPLQASIDGAAYYPAPPFKGTGGGRFYVTTGGNDPARLAQHNHAAVADLAAHEGFPGHDWNYRVMGRFRDRISLVRWLTPGAVEDSSSMWEDSLATEGWALYSEALMAEPQPGAPDGFYSPEEHLFQLQGQLYRDLRVRLDTGLHTGRLSFDDAVNLYSRVVDFQPGDCRDPALLKENASKRASCDSAKSAIFRYSRWPTQALTYKLGKDQILALRAEAAQKLGARFSAQRFHLEFMKQGTIPPGYFREPLLAALSAGVE